MIYLLDTNLISDLLKRDIHIRNQIQQYLEQGDTLAICRPVYYELMRGLLWTKANTKQTVLHNDLIPQFQWLPLHDDDWTQAARFWADAVSKGKQLADVDLLLAAVAY